MIDNYISGLIPAYPEGWNPSKIPREEAILKIEQAVCQFYSLTDLKSKSREETEVKAKKIYRYLLHEEGIGIRRIGRISGISHSAAHESIISVKGYLDVGDEICGEIWAIRAILQECFTSSSTAHYMAR